MAIFGQKMPKMTRFWWFLAISAKNMASTPGRTPPTLEVLVKAHRLRYVTQPGASPIFCKLQKCAIFKAFSAKQRVFLSIDFEIFSDFI